MYTIYTSQSQDLIAAAGIAVDKLNLLSLSFLNRTPELASFISTFCPFYFISPPFLSSIVVCPPTAISYRDNNTATDAHLGGKIGTRV